MSTSTPRVTPHGMHRLGLGGTTAAVLNARPNRTNKGRHISRLFLERIGFMPCVLYEAESSGLTYVSENIFDLLGFRCDAVIGRPSFWREYILEKDFALFEEKFMELDAGGATSFMHRMVNSVGLPVWVSHSLKKEVLNGTAVIRGCLVPIESDKRVHSLDQSMVSRFIHKLGNHFQLLTLTINSLRKSLPESREAEILQDTLEKAIELTRTFSDCNQLPLWKSEIRLLEVFQAAISSKRAAFSAKNVGIKEQLDGAMGDMTIVGDPFLLEVAFGQILDNALDATPSAGLVLLHGKLMVQKSTSPVARLRALSVCPDRNDRTGPLINFKGNAEGMDLSVASRFIEMHGGLLRIREDESGASEVEISLPVDAAKDLSCA